MKKSVQQIAELVGGAVHGAADAVLESVAALQNAGPTDLAYAEEKFHAEAAASRAGCVIVKSGTPAAAFAGRTVIFTGHPKLAFARAAAVLLAEHAGEPETFIHPTAVVEADADIGRHTRIGAGCYVGKGVRIGSHSVLHPRVTLYAGVEIGARVIIHSGAVIGADGFGFVRDAATGEYVKFPQTGKVVIEDDVEIGANTCIDRGSLGTTVIRRGVKLDNLIQVGHNVEIGEHTVIAAQTGISGSAVIGPHSVIGGQAGIGEHARLDGGSIIGGQGGVLNGKRIRGGELLWGTPVRPLKEFLRQQAALARLPAWLAEMKKSSDK